MKSIDIKNFFYKNAIFFIFAVSFLYILPSFNKFWHPYDEWFMLEAGYMASKGMVPYRDFFILPYPPAQIYVIMALIKIFGASIIAVRMYTILVQSAISVCVFYIIRKLAPLKYALIGFIVCVSILPSYARPIPISTWPGIALSLLSTSFMLDFIHREKTIYLVSASFLVGLAVIFRHDIAFFTFLSGIAGLLMFSLLKLRQEKNSIGRTTTSSFRLCSTYAIFPILFISATVIWLYKVNALPDAFRALFIGLEEYIKKATLPFPHFCFAFNMIFHRGCFFIKQNQFYIPPLICAVCSVLISSELIVKRKLDKRIISLVILLLLAIFYLPQVAMRTDRPHLAVAFPPSAILFGLIFTFRIKYKNIFFVALIVSALSFVTLLMALLVYKDTESYFKDTYGKAFIKKSIEPVAFKQGTLYVPDDGRETLLALMEYVEKNTNPDEKIYVGPLNHSIPQFNPYQVLYFVTERLPAVKYYQISPGLQDRESIQEEMIDSLAQNKAKVLFLRDYKTDEANLGPLDEYIREEYKLDKIIDSYHIYIRK